MSSALDYPLFRAAGTPAELGRQHGTQARELIHQFLDWLQSTLRLSRQQLEQRAERFRPFFDRHCPQLVEEIAGLAAGAGLSPSAALALQLRGELGCVVDGGCTTFVVAPRGTRDGHVLIGQTSDGLPEIERLGYVLQLSPVDRPAVLMWTFGGMLGYHGLNRLGMAHFANALAGGPAWKPGLSHYPVKRMLLECRNLEEVRSLLGRVPVCSNGNYVLCDGSGQILDIELTSDGPLEIADPGRGFLVHTNHYLCAPHACQENHAQGLPDSQPRLERIQELISNRFGTLTVADLQACLADHGGYPVGICRHPHSGSDFPMLSRQGKTVAALIAEPARGILHVARGNPCTAPFVAYHLP